MAPYVRVTSPTLTHDLSVVLPALNPGPALYDVVHDLRTTFVNLNLEIILVDDGSTPPLVPPPGVVLLRGPNQGKGAALRAGLNEATAPVLAYMDSDGSYTAASLLTMYNAVTSNAAPIIIASRPKPASLRGLLSHVFYRWVWIWHRLPYDTQAGLKLFRADLWRAVEPRIRATGFAFDVDLLSQAKRAGFHRPALLGVTPVLNEESTVNLRRSAAALLEVARVALPQRRRH